MIELKPCPFCGHLPHTTTDSYADIICSNARCRLYEVRFSETSCNNRPYVELLEKTLRAKLCEGWNCPTSREIVCPDHEDCERCFMDWLRRKAGVRAGRLTQEEVPCHEDPAGCDPNACGGCGDPARDRGVRPI